MQYKVLKIEEDMDFGCEERQPGEALMSVVLMEDENGNEKTIKISPYGLDVLSKYVFERR